MVLLSTLLMFFNTYFMMIFLKIFHNVMRELNILLKELFNMAHTFHLFKETTDLPFDLTDMADFLNQLRNPVMGLLLNTVALGH